MVVDLVTTVEGRVCPLAARSITTGASWSSRLPRPCLASPAPRGRWLVRFAGVGSREEAESLVGATLRAEPLAGAEGSVGPRTDRCGSGRPVGEATGMVAAVEANPASDLLVLDSGALVPLRFVVAAEPGRLTVDAPAGLFGP